MKSTRINRINASFFKWILLIPFLGIFAMVFILGRNLLTGIAAEKYFWFYGCMAVVSLATLITVIFKKHSRFSFLDLLILLFVGSVFLSALVFNNASQNTAKLTLLALLPVLYFGFRTVSGEATHLFCIFIIITGLVEAIWGLMQLYGFSASYNNLFKINGSFFNSGPYGGYLAVVFPLSLYYLLYNIQFNSRVFAIAVKCTAGITCAAIMLILPSAMSRASWLAVIAGSVIIVYTYYSKRLPLKKYCLRHKKQIWLLGIVSILFLFAAFIGIYFLKKNSADGRMFISKISVQIILKHPLGVGLGNFSGAYGNEQAVYFASGKANKTEELIANCPEYGFNEYLQIFVESGVVSFLLFMVIIILTFRSMMKKRDWGILGSLISVLVFAFFSYPFNVLPFLIVLMFLLATSSSETKYIRKIHRFPAILLSCFCLFVSCFCLYKQYFVYDAYKKWNFHSKSHEDLVFNYSKIRPLLNDQIHFLFEYAQVLSIDKQYEKSNEILRRAMQIGCDPMLYNIMGKNYQSLKEYKFAEQSFIKAANIVPNRLYPHYFLAKLYHEMGLKDKAEAETNIVLTKPPKVESKAVEEMKEELIQLIINN
jgi:tetratricopeptide (TPR) repeat protein